MPGWFAFVYVESGQIKSAELNPASGSLRGVPEGLESLGFAEGYLFLERRFALENEDKQTTITKGAGASV